MVLPMVQKLQRYHQHRVLGLDSIPEQGPALIVVNHSLATYDIMLLTAAILEHTGRMARGLGDRLIFKIPGLREFAHSMGVVEGCPDHGRTLLAQNELVVVAPGGMREALRPSDERYQVQWDDRRGFARLAIEAQVPVVLAACPLADDLYTVYANPVTTKIYERFRFPFPLMRGRGLSWMPKQIPLTHYLSEPLFPPVHTQGTPPRDMVDRFHRSIVERMKQLMAEGVMREQPN